MGSACSCIKAVKEPKNIKKTHNFNSSSSHLKSIFPANLQASSKKTSDIHTKENFNEEEIAGFSRKTSNINNFNNKLTLFAHKPTSFHEDRLFIIKKRQSDNSFLNESLQVFNNFAEPMVKLVKICNKKENFRESDCEDSLELDENRKSSIAINYQEVAP